MTQYGLIGRTLGHSWSARLFDEFFRREGIDARYDLYELPSVSELPSLIGGNPALAGLNVTIPYKQEVIPLLVSVSDLAREAGAVNTIRIRREAGGKVRLEGFNTDVEGFRLSVSPMLADVSEDRRRALVLGSGGASKAVVTALRHMGWESAVVSRTPVGDQISYADLTPALVWSHALIVNTTPLGMYPKVDAAPPFPYQYLGARHVCYDLVYNPEDTLFLRICRAHGCRVMGGLEMLKLQAMAAWRIWTEG